jgi:hypothetical protein
MRIGSVCLMLSGALFSSWALAQTVDVNKIPADDSGTTTIRIQKDHNIDLPAAAARPAWEVQDGTADVEGEASATAKDAKKAWQQACKDWKKETRDDNKDNKVLNLNCGSASCSGEAGSKICTSKATYKIKTRVDN